MDFTPLLPGSLISSVACDVYVVSLLLPSRLIVRSINSLSIKRVINLDPTFASLLFTLKWAPRTTNTGHRRLLAADAKTVMAWDLEDYEWELCISEGLGGVRNVEWSETGDAILVWSEHQLKMTVWSLSTSSGTIVPHPKFHNKGYGFRLGNAHFGLLQRTANHDQVSLFDTTSSDWRLVFSTTLPTSDAQGFKWSPDGKWFAVWEAATEYLILVYTFDGRLVKRYSAYQIGLGVKTVSWSPDGEYLAVGSYDGLVRMLNNRTFSPVIDLTHNSVVQSEATVVWRQVTMASITKYEMTPQPISLQVIKSLPTDANPKLGIGVLAFNPDGSLLATRCDSMPSAVWIWSLREMSPIAILVQDWPLKTLRWHPQESGLLVMACTASTVEQGNALYLWNQEWDEPRVIQVPKEAFEVKWFNIIENESEPEHGILIGSAESFTIGYPVDEVKEAHGFSIIEEEAQEDSSA